MLNRSLLSVCLFMLGALLAGCTTTPSTSFYSLTSVTPKVETPSVLAKEVALRIGPFGFPNYLQRPNIVTRTSGNSIDVSEFHRWAGSLEDDFHLALGANLGVLLKSTRISIYPADIRFEPDYYLTGDVITFDGEFGGQVLLDVRWTINRKNDQNALVVHHSIINEPVNGRDYVKLIAAYQRAIFRLSQEMQSEIIKIK